MAKMPLWPLLLALGAFLLDQLIKALFMGGFVWHSSCLSLTLAYNDGVAFSLLAFLGPWLKVMQTAAIVALLIFGIRSGMVAEYRYEAALFFAAALSNLFDRFTVGVVVDYVYWHCGFDFAIFNLADVLIDLSVVLVLWKNFRKHKETIG